MMLLLIKFIILQVFWFFTVTQMKNFSALVFLLSALILIFLDYFFYRPQKNIIQYMGFVIFLIFTGAINDLVSYKFSLLDFSHYSYGSLALWIVFVGYYEDLSIRYKEVRFLFLVLLSGIVGSFTYYSAAKLGGISIVETKKAIFYSYQFVFWGLFFPLSLKLYRINSMFDYLLDLSVVYSFDRTGFLRHKKKFDETFSYPMALGKHALVTGGTDGIGAEAAKSLAQYGAIVTFTGRSAEKASKLQKEQAGLSFHKLDMSNWQEIINFTNDLTSVDFIVCNAGGMPDNYSLNREGVEFQCASQLVGHYLLIDQLRKKNKLNQNARIVFVSSGGMYLKTLDLSTLFNNTSYDKVATYANVKRAQVTLLEELSLVPDWKDFTLMSMHPGWVQTQGVKDALPGFYDFWGKRLRLPHEGADTILWCLLTSKKLDSGAFYFDRKKVSAYINNYFCPNAKERIELMEKLNSFISF